MKQSVFTFDHGISTPFLSFYTFQTMSYSIDVYRGEVKPEKNFLNFMTYVSMFPQLIAGPIVRYETIAKELHNVVMKSNEVMKQIKEKKTVDTGNSIHYNIAV